jgi:transposase-like protein
MNNRKVRKYICREFGRMFDDRTNIFFNIHKDEYIIDLALKVNMKGMPIEDIAYLLGIKPATFSNQVTNYFAARNNLKK